MTADFTPSVLENTSSTCQKHPAAKVAFSIYIIPLNNKKSFQNFKNHSQEDLQVLGFLLEL